VKQVTARRPAGSYRSRLASWQFGLSVSGLIAILPGLALIGMGQPAMGKPFAIAGSLLTIASMLLFVVIVFRATRAQRRIAPAQ
jgi:Na+/melibiose symporter-like transporter